jgi:hypothetical protein
VTSDSYCGGGSNEATWEGRLANRFRVVVMWSVDAVRRPDGCCELWTLWYRFYFYFLKSLLLMWHSRIVNACVAIIWSVSHKCLRLSQKEAEQLFEATR